MNPARSAIMLLCLALLSIGCRDSRGRSDCTEADVQRLFTEDGTLPDATIHIRKLFDARKKLDSCAGNAYVRNYLAVQYLESAMYLDVATPEEINLVTQHIRSISPADIQGEREVLVFLGKQQLLIILGLIPNPDSSDPTEPLSLSLAAAVQNNLGMCGIVSDGIKINRFDGIHLRVEYPGDVSDIVSAPR